MSMAIGALHLSAVIFNMCATTRRSARANGY